VALLSEKHVKNVQRMPPAGYQSTDAGARAAAAGNVLLRAEVRGSTVLLSLLIVFLSSTCMGGSVAKWLACWTQVQGAFECHQNTENFSISEDSAQGSPSPVDIVTLTESTSDMTSSVAAAVTLAVSRISTTTTTI